MRIIDADKLPRRNVVERYPVFKNGRLSFAHTFTEIVRVKDLEAAPTVDAVEVVHGRWLPNDVEQVVDNYISPYYAAGYFRAVNYRCNLCGRVEENKEPYCNCGAKMDGERRADHDTE